MFTPRRLLPFSLCCFLLVGCATNPQTTASVIPTAPTQTTAAPSTLTTTVQPTSGNSIAGRSDYLQANGSLSPFLQTWATELATLNQLPLSSVESLLKSASYNADAARLMAPSKGRIKRSWSTYKNRFIEPIRIKAGLDFWQANAQQIQQSADHYGVPAEIIVSIIGVETIYGRYTGDFNVLDALLTLGFSYPDNSRPERGQLFREQLADLLVLHHAGKIDAYTAKGSFAGAMGLPQFMPGSLMRYAVDADQDGKIDLYNSIPDITASVANFLRVHGWIPQQPVFAPVGLYASQAATLVDGGLVPRLNWQQITAAKANSTTPAAASWQQQPLGVINLVEESKGTAEYRLATPNFFALTAYNRSYFYATTVADFAEVLAKQHKLKN